MVYLLKTGGFSIAMLNHQRVPILMWSDSGARLLIFSPSGQVVAAWSEMERMRRLGAAPSTGRDDHGIGKSMGNHWEIIGTRTRFPGWNLLELVGFVMVKKRHSVTESQGPKAARFFQLKRRLSHWSRGFLSVVINLHLSSSQPFHRNLEPTQCETWRNKTNQGDCCPHMSQGSALRVVERLWRWRTTNHDFVGHFASPSEFLPSLYHGSPVHTRWGTLLS